MLTRFDAAAALGGYWIHVIEEESVLSVVLKGQMLIEIQIENLIKAVYVDPSVFDLNRMLYPQKLDLLVAIGIFSKKEIAPYKKFNNIRRKFAHDLSYKLSFADLNKVKDTLSEKHKIIIGKDLLEQEDMNSLLKKILFSLLTLPILQNSIDERFNKSAKDPMTTEELEYYRALGEDVIKAEKSIIPKIN
ncbi:hypothetical protein [Planomicrobium sp. Y74]|uniref:hypothetical protein n=1 Tax=Planomicrobium sp. Y74 TaxID=2478977 RepID=UPI000EF45F9B|nr:hypothetical protein [Planomicrobium sp. Y74]RLQ92115.1 hypothetical protein D9754_04845 [Planomicrobium sp. Y74]